MSHEPAFANPLASLSLAQMIALNLTRLYTWLIQMSASGQQHAPRDIAQMVASTDALVHAFIRSRAMAQLEAAGYFRAARAMRVPAAMRASPLKTPQLAITTSEVEPVALEDLLYRVEAMIDQFEQAEAIGSVLARIIVCALLYVSPETHIAPVYCGVMPHHDIYRIRANFRPSRLTRRGRGPPVSPDPGSSPGTVGDLRYRTHNSFPGARPCVRDPEPLPIRQLNSNCRTNLSADARENGYPRLGRIKRFDVRGVDPRSSLGSAGDRASAEFCSAR